MLGKFIARDFIAIAGEMHRFPASNENTVITSALTPFSELLPNLYYSPIKKLETIFIFKIARQRRP
jgi:hypothetical protein